MSRGHRGLGEEGGKFDWSGRSTVPRKTSALEGLCRRAKAKGWSKWSSISLGRSSLGVSVDAGEADISVTAAATVPASLTLTKAC